MRDGPFDPDAIVELYRMPYHMALAFKSICAAASAVTPEEKMAFMGAVQEHADKELVRLRALLRNEEPRRLYGAVLDPDYGLAEEALAEAYEQRDLLKAQKKEGEK